MKRNGTMVYTLTEIKTRNGYSKSYTLYETEKQFESTTKIHRCWIHKLKSQGKIILIKSEHPWFNTIRNKCTSTGIEIDLSEFYPLVPDPSIITYNIEIEI